ncbi:hypothetical protein MHYP_G00331590 [Metynnis hypsauchen]
MPHQFSGPRELDNHLSRTKYIAADTNLRSCHTKKLDPRRTAFTMIRVYYIIGVALFVLEVRVVQALLANTNDCCGRIQKTNETCANSTHCYPGCLHVLENNTCVPCDSLSSELENFTLCYYTKTSNNSSISTPIKIGGPGIAASVLFGTLLISLFLILSVASFFYLKRSNRLPGVFYKRNKAFIFQPSETAVMIPADTSSVRKPRYGLVSERKGEGQRFVAENRLFLTHYGSIFECYFGGHTLSQLMSGLTEDAE